MLIHLGDVEGDEDYIPAVADCPVHMVRGNNDFFSGLPGEEEFMIGGYHIFITHGHGYYVSMGEERLKQEARGRGADIAMYGHTHRPFYEKEKDFKFGLQPSTLAKKTLGISYAEAEEFALSVYRQYVLNLPNDNVKEITERAIHSWQSQVIVAHKDQKGVETCQIDL